MSNLWKSLTEVNEIDIKFTELINKLQKNLSGCFVNYSSDFGNSNELKDFIFYAIPSELYENPADDDDMRLYYTYNPKYVISLMNWLAEYDMVFVKNNRCVVSRSNQNIAAQMLNKMLKLA